MPFHTFTGFSSVWVMPEGDDHNLQVLMMYGFFFLGFLFVVYKLNSYFNRLTALYMREEAEAEAKAKRQ